MKTQLLSILGSLALSLPAGAQPTAFTFQGQLKDAGQPASGPHDFQFRLFDLPSGGSQLGPTLCVDNLALNNGVFTTTLDFGQQYSAASPQRFLEVQVRADIGSDCSNQAGFLVLGPRQRPTPAPAASHANAAVVLDAPDGSHPNALLLDDALRLGIGTVTPAATLHLLTGGEGVRLQGSTAGNVASVGFFDADGTRIGTLGDVSAGDNAISLASTVDSVHLYPGFGQALTATSAGNVGIGTTVPSAKLDVRGEINFGASNECCTIAGPESLRIIRGTIGSSGNIINGSGFTVTQTATGKYSISFVPGFAGLPAITATVPDNGGAEALPFLEFAGSGSVLLEVYQRDNGNFVNKDVHFMAVGPR